MKTVETTITCEEKLVERTDLQLRYRKIGISALAAALRYPNERKNPRYAPATPRRNRFDADADAA